MMPAAAAESAGPPHPCPCWIHFGDLFDNHAPPILPLTKAAADHVRAQPEWHATHDLANAVKHRWTGSIVHHHPHPEVVRREVDGTYVIYAGFGIHEVDAEQVDAICRRGQRSLNLLVELATTLDREIDWERYFSFS